MSSTANFFSLLFFTAFLFISPPFSLPLNSSPFPTQDDAPPSTRRNLHSSVSDSVILRSRTTISSENQTFTLGFFSPNPQIPSDNYLGIWYASITTPTYVWVANRRIPVKNITSASLTLNSDSGRLAISDSVNFNVWESDNDVPGVNWKLQESGNLVLSSHSGEIVWQSFDFPTDTWLPGMNLTKDRELTCWKSLYDPCPGRYSLRLKPPEYGEIELVYRSSNDGSSGSTPNNNTLTVRNVTVPVPYWSTGNWNLAGNFFANVPQMTVPYIYKFHFNNPFTPSASFGYTEISVESGLRPPLTRFQVDFAGQLLQYTWSQQTANWNMFWSQPENRCRVYGLCGGMGFCYSTMTILPSKVCQCLDGFRPVDEFGWDSGDFSGGCRRIEGRSCDEGDGFEEIGIVSFDGVRTVSFHGENEGFCERSCLRNCSCVGLCYDKESGLCKNLYGSMLNLRNLSSYESTGNEVLYLRVGISRRASGKNKALKGKIAVVAAASVCGLIVFVSLMALMVWIVRKKIKARKAEEEAILATNLKVFSYKELHSATRGFSEKLGHGGFGTVFRGILSDSSVVAVKRLERPGSGEKEFRAEVCTIGNVQHVNLVRLRGFCSENSHRLLVYDYMPNGPLSAYLKKKKKKKQDSNDDDDDNDSINNGQVLSWDVRYRVAIGTARALVYLHEECRDCIIHCDIKPENILLDLDYTAKVSDFGLAKLIGRDFSRVLATMRGTWGYVAPEWISGVAITTKADVYSYGMTVLELMGGRRNVESPPSENGNGEEAVGGGGGGGDDKNKWFFPPWAARQIIEGHMDKVVDQRLGGAYNRVEAERLGMVAVWCIQDEEAARPTMGSVVKMLEGVVEVAVPPPPKLLQALVSGESSFPGVGVESGTGGGRGGESSVDEDDDDIRISQYSSSSSPGNIASLYMEENEDPHHLPANTASLRTD